MLDTSAQYNIYVYVFHVLQTRLLASWLPPTSHLGDSHCPHLLSRASNPWPYTHRAGSPPYPPWGGIRASHRDPLRASQVLLFSSTSQSRYWLACKLGMNISSMLLNCWSQHFLPIPIFSFHLSSSLTTVFEPCCCRLSPSCSSPRWRNNFCILSSEIQFWGCDDAEISRSDRNCKNYRKFDLKVILKAKHSFKAKSDAVTPN
jgi:hypothetical protein